MTNRMYMVRKGGYWYRPESAGYTGVPADAGLYSIDEALSQVDQGVSFVAQSENLKDDLLSRLRVAQVASCTCLTKTPVVDYHSPACLYRILDEAHTVIKRGLVDPYDEDDENPMCTDCDSRIGRDGCFDKPKDCRCPVTG